MKLVDAILRPKWLVFGATYGAIAFLVSVVAAMVLTALVTPFIPGLADLITGAEPTSSILSGVSIPVVGGLIAGLCILGGVLISSIISMIYWYVSSWAYDISKLTPFWLFAKKLSNIQKMVYAGLLIPMILLVFAIFFNIVAFDIVAIFVNLLKFAIQIMWLIFIVYATWFTLKLVKMKIPTEAK